MTNLGIGINISKKCCCKKLSGSGGKPVYPNWFNNSIVCWYDIKRQGATNESLTLDPKLIDLSGNNRHLTLVGFDTFTEDNGITKHGDALLFNKNNCYGISENQPTLTDYTIICKRIGRSFTYGTVASKSVTNYDVDGAFIFETWKYRANYSFGGENHFDNHGEIISYQTKTSYNGIPLKVGNLPDTNTLYIGSTRTITDTWNGELYAFLLFDKSLELWQIDWIKKHLLGDEDYYAFDDHSPILYDNHKTVNV